MFWLLVWDLSASAILHILRWALSSREWYRDAFEQRGNATWVMSAFASSVSPSLSPCLCLCLSLCFSASEAVHAVAGSTCPQHSLQKFSPRPVGRGAQSPLLIQVGDIWGCSVRPEVEGSPIMKSLPLLLLGEKCSSLCQSDFPTLSLLPWRRPETLWNSIQNLRVIKLGL